MQVPTMLAKLPIYATGIVLTEAHGFTVNTRESSLGRVWSCAGGRLSLILANLDKLYNRIMSSSSSQRVDSYLRAGST
jgi:hypothetical protein